MILHSSTNLSMCNNKTFFTLFILLSYLCLRHIWDRKHYVFGLSVRLCVLKAYVRPGGGIIRPAFYITSINCHICMCVLCM